MTASNYADDAPGDAPSWFTEAWARPCSTGEVDVGGILVRYLVWEPSAPTGEPPLLLLHGTAAHARWWTHIASVLSADRQVVAVDFSGHGDSDHRPSYRADLWADEVLAVAAAVDRDRTGVCIVGHSLGGIVATVATARDAWPVVGVAMCETIRDPSGPYDEIVVAKPRRYFPTFEAALARFRPVPSQPNCLPYVVERIGRHSMRKFPDGWSWKYDTGFIEGLPQTLPLTDDLLAAIDTEVALIRGEHGLVTPADVSAMVTAAGSRLQVVELPAAGHHPMLDQPLALAVAIRMLAAGWCRGGRS